MSDWEGGKRPWSRWRRLGIGLVMVVVAAVATTVCTARHRPQLAIDADVEPTVRASESVAGPRAGTVLVDGIVIDQDGTVADGFVTDDAAVLPDYDAAIDVLRRLQDASR
ncbi:MAG: hypothetical protein M3R09_05480 [Actinomycetota bacterium]|nr:hypothetical protein [Actinomycetota bacterium]